MPNPSFEDTVHCPFTTGQIEFAKNWFQPFPVSSSDYYNICSNYLNIVTDIQTPRTGGAYSGIHLAGGDWREYIEVKLKEPLTSGNLYCIEFYVSLFEYSYAAVDAVGMYISLDSIYTIGSGLETLPYTPQINNPEGNILLDSLGWTKVSGTYTAIGGEQFITIGNFHLTGDFNEYPLNGSGASYYLIDDVALYLCDDTIPKPKELKIPNVFTPQQDGMNEVFFIENLPEQSHLIIYNRWGQSILDKKNYLNNWDAHEVNAGVYYYVLALPDGERKTGFIHVIK